VRDEAARRETDLRNEADRRERLMEERYKEKLEAEKREAERQRDSARQDHEREVKSIDRQNELVLTTRLSNHESQLAMKDQQIGHLKEELERARAEAAEKDDLETQVEKITRTAGVLGLSRAEPEEKMDWRERLADAAGKMLINLDKTVGRVADTLKERNEGMRLHLTAASHARRAAAEDEQGPPEDGAPPRRRIRTGASPAAAASRTTWATEEGATIDLSDDATSRTPYPDEGIPAERPRPRSLQADVLDEPPREPPRPPPPREEPPREGAPPAQATHPTTPAAQQQGFDAEELDRFRQWVEMCIERDDDPREFAQELVANIGYAQAAQMRQQVTPAMLFAALEGDPRMSRSSILRPSGQKFVKAAWAAMADLIERGPPKPAG
jgi:hypothetical protein